MARLSRPVLSVFVLIASALIAASVVVGLRVPAATTLAPFPPGSALDYDATFRARVAPLRESFIREVLGGSGTTPALRRTRSPGSSLAAPRNVSDPFGAPRTVDAHPFVNDDMADARTIATIPFTGRTDTTGATRERGETGTCGGEGGTAWYRYGSSRSEELIANTFGTNYAVHLGVYELTSPGSLDVVDCDSDLTGNALVQFPTAAGKTYLFQLTAETAGGRSVFSLEPSGRTELISATETGEQGSSQSLSPSISSDGRYVAFSSFASDLAADGPDAPCATRASPPRSPEAASDNIDPAFPCSQVYVTDRVAGAMRIASVSSMGAIANGQANAAAISGDGRSVAFVSAATNLVEGDTNEAADVFVHDLVTGRTERVSLAWDGGQSRSDPTASEASVSRPSISRDGRFVAFESRAENLVPGDTNGAPDVFVRDRLTGRTERVSVSTGEGRAREAISAALPLVAPRVSAAPAISADGRYVVFTSTAADLAPKDENQAPDLFLRDRMRGTTELISIALTGVPGNAGSAAGAGLSDDGRYVAFLSASSDLVDGDGNEVTDIFVRDRTSRRTVRASISSAGEEADKESFDPTISGNGRYVVFSSIATELAPGNRSVQGGPSCRFVYLSVTCPEDLYVHDLLTRTTVRLPVAPSCRTEGTAVAPSVSADGASVAFYSGTIDCVPDLAQVWVHDRHRRAP